MKPHLRLVEKTVARLPKVPRIPPREDVVEYSSGHVWIRNAEHEKRVLRAISWRLDHG